MDAGTLDDLVNQAEKLTAEIAADTRFPRVERNLRQLAEAGQQLWSRTTQGAAAQPTSDVKASILLGGKGYDLQKVSQKLDALSTKKPATAETTRVPDVSLDIQSFLKNEREMAILSVIDEVKKSTIERIDQLYWENMEKEWAEEKGQILSDLSLDTSALDTSIHSHAEPSPPKQKDIIDTVIQLVREGKSYETLLGSISSDGCRIPGNIKNLNPSLNVDETIKLTALECEKQAFLEDAVRLFDLCGEHSKALEIMNKLLSGVVSEKPQTELSQRDKLEGLALRLAERYSLHGHNANKGVAATFFLLLDLMTFFSYYHRQSFHDALDTIEKLNIIPLSVSQMESKVSEFNRLSHEIQRNIPDILVATMNILYAQYKETKSTTPPTVAKFGMSPELGNREQRLTDIRAKSKTLTTYAGMLPYRMPRETNAKIIQLDVLMN